MSWVRLSRSRTGRPVSVAPVVEAEHVGDDLLRLRRVLGAALHEHLAALVDERQRRVRLEVEVLLPGHLGDPAEDVGSTGQPLVEVTADHHRPATLEAALLDGLGQGDDRGQRLVVDLDGRGTEPRGLEGLPQHPADGVADEHHLVGEQRLVVLHPGVVHARHVGPGQQPHHARDVKGRGGVEPGHAGMGVRRAHRVGVQDVAGAVHEVVGVERVAGDVQGRALVGQG